MATLKGQITKEYLKKFPKTSKHTLAEKLFKENQLLFKDVEEARYAIRYYTGSAGSRDKKIAEKANSLVDHNTNFSASNPFGLPESDAKPFEPYILPKVNNNVLFLSDPHLPYHDIKALTIALEYGKKHNINTIYLNGDILDCYQASFHEKDPKKRDLANEFEIGRQFIDLLIREFPKAKIFWKEGNHEMRWERYLRVKSPIILDMDEFRIERILKLAEKGVTWIPNKQLVQMGKLNVIHGNEYKGGGGINVARTLWLRAGDNVIAGDKHKTQSGLKTNIDKSVTGTWSVGCLCYSEDTEILTQNGFKLFKDVSDSDKIGVYDKDINSIRLSTPIKRQVFDYEGDMVNFSDNKIDLLVTPEHKMIYINHSGKTKISESSKLNESKATYNYYSSARFESKESFDSDLSELCAWIITEGSIDYAKGKYPRISIYQKKEYPRLKLEELIDRLGIEASVSIDKRSGVYKYRFSNKSSLTIIDKIWDGEFKKRIPRKILNSNYDVLEKVYETLIITDGHRRKDGGISGTDYLPSKDIELANDYAEIAMKLGFTYYIKREIRNTNYKSNATIYLVRIRKSQVTRCRNVSIQKYVGKVYDFTSETGWLVVRRNGKVTISSNCELNPDYLPFNEWNLGFAHIEIMDSGEFMVHNKQIINGKIL